MYLPETARLTVVSWTPTTSATQKNGIARSTLAQTWAQVLSDLNTADSLMELPASQNPVRANKETAWALKARYYLYQQNWAEAESYATQVLADGTHVDNTNGSQFYRDDQGRMRSESPASAAKARGNRLGLASRVSENVVERGPSKRILP